MRVIGRKKIAFVRYKMRSTAEFAKVSCVRIVDALLTLLQQAMADQSLIGKPHTVQSWVACTFSGPTVYVCDVDD